MESFRQEFNIDAQADINRNHKTGEVIVTTPGKTVQLKYSRQSLNIISSFPVVIRDTGGGSTKLNRYDPSCTVFHGTIGDLFSARRLNSGDWYVECRSDIQRKRLLNLKQINGAEIECHIPIPKTHGVVFDLGNRYNLENLPEVQKCFSINTVNKHTGKRQTMTVITFSLSILPESIINNGKFYKVYPYCPKVKRCTKCQKLGHGLKSCTSKVTVCSRCGCIHNRKSCNATTPKCANCNGKHSAAYGGCPKKYQMRAALRLKSQKYMSLKDAFHQVSSKNTSKSNEKSFVSYSDILKKSKQRDADTQTESDFVTEKIALSTNDNDNVLSDNIFVNDNHCQTDFSNYNIQGKNLSKDAQTQVGFIYLSEFVTNSEHETIEDCSFEYFLKFSYIPFLVSIMFEPNLFSNAIFVYEYWYSRLAFMSEQARSMLNNITTKLNESWLVNLMTWDEHLERVSCYDIGRGSYSWHNLYSSQDSIFHRAKRSNSCSVLS